MRSHIVGWALVRRGRFHGEPGGRSRALQVVYITDVDTSTTPGAGYLNVRYRQDIEAARAFLKAHYPNLADKLEMGSYELMPCRGGDPFDIR